MRSFALNRDRAAISAVSCDSKRSGCRSRCPSGQALSTLVGRPRADVGRCEANLGQTSTSSAPTVVLERAQTGESPGVRVILLPTSHAGGRSGKDAEEVIRNTKPDVLLLEVCDERINGVIKRLSGGTDDVLVPEVVYIHGLPTGTLPGGVEISTLLSRLKTRIGTRVNASDLLKDTETLMRTGLFDSVHVSAVGKLGTSVVWEGGRATVETLTSEIIFDVVPADGELTSDIRFVWSDAIIEILNTDMTETEARVIRRAGELVEMSESVSGDGEMGVWQFGALCSAILIAVREEIPDQYAVTLDLSDEDVISVKFADKASLTPEEFAERVFIDIENILSVSFSARSAATEAVESSSVSVKMMNTMLKLAESTISNKVDAKDGEEIITGLSTAFDSQVSRVYLADLKLSKIMLSLDTKVKRNVAGTKRSIFRYVLESIRSLITFSFKTKEEVTAAIETERLELMRTGDVDMPTHMREVLIDERDDVIFDCLWAVSQGERIDRPCFSLEDSCRYEYSERAPPLILRMRESTPVTIVAILGAAHLPGIIRRWNTTS